jgi:hypothetical protein
LQEQSANPAKNIVKSCRFLFFRIKTAVSLFLYAICHPVFTQKNAPADNPSGLWRE